MIASWQLTGGCCCCICCSVGAERTLRVHSPDGSTFLSEMTSWLPILRVLCEASCLHYLLPDKRNSSVTGRLPHAKTFELLPTRTIKFRNFFSPVVCNYN